MEVKKENFTSWGNENRGWTMKMKGLGTIKKDQFEGFGGTIDSGANLRSMPSG